MEFYDELVKPLLHSPHKMDNESEATFSLTCCFTAEESHVAFLSKLPRRPADHPYLLFSHGLDMSRPQNFTRAQNLINSRSDFLYMNYDLRDHLLADDHAEKLPGVTLAPPTFYSGEIKSLEEPSKFFLTFRGSIRKGRHGSSSARTVMNRIAKHVKQDDVVLEFVEPILDALHHKTPSADKNRFNELLDTSYSLMLRGQGRWSYRFSEAVGACTIPVFLVDGRGDGMTLPFEDLIDWSDATVQLGEKLGFRDETQLLQYLEEHPKALLDNIPNDPETISRMRQKVCKINDKYFATPTRRAVAALKSAAVAAKKRTLAEE